MIYEFLKYLLTFRSPGTPKQVLLITKRKVAFHQVLHCLHTIDLQRQKCILHVIMTCDPSYSDIMDHNNFNVSIQLKIQLV